MRLPLIQSLLARHRDWEARYLQLLEDLIAGRPPDPHWQARFWRRWLRDRLARISAGELAQILAFTRAWRGWRLWIPLLALLALGALLAVPLHLWRPDRLGWGESLLLSQVMVLGTGLGLVGAWFSPGQFDKGWRLWAKVVAMAIVGGLVGASFAAWQRGQTPLQMLERIGPTVAGASMLAGLLFTLASALLAGLRNRELRALNEQLRAEAEAQALRRQASEAQLRLLQAQIEPHFLFNTLGAVQHLAQAGAPQAAALTADLIRFLRASMNSLREAERPLGDEMALSRSYLRVMQARLGARLRVAVELPEALAARRVPGTLLITLVENAIKHGIEPQPDGGDLKLRAWSEGGELFIEVADTGRGMADLPGAGHGLSNLREQLHLRHGARARLELFDNEPRGLVARLVLPEEGKNDGS